MIKENPTFNHIVDIQNKVASESGATEKGLEILKKASLSNLFRRAIYIANSRVNEVKTMIEKLDS